MANIRENAKFNLAKINPIKVCIFLFSKENVYVFSKENVYVFSKDNI